MSIRDSTALAKCQDGKSTKATDSKALSTHLSTIVVCHGLQLVPRLTLAMSAILDGAYHAFSAMSEVFCLASELVLFKCYGTFKPAHLLVLL